MSVLSPKGDAIHARPRPYLPRRRLRSRTEDRRRKRGPDRVRRPVRRHDERVGQSERNPGIQSEVDSDVFSEIERRRSTLLVRKTGLHRFHRLPAVSRSPVPNRLVPAEPFGSGADQLHEQLRRHLLFHQRAQAADVRSRRDPHPATRRVGAQAPLRTGPVGRERKIRQDEVQRERQEPGRRVGRHQTIDVPVEGTRQSRSPEHDSEARETHGTLDKGELGGR